MTRAWSAAALFLLACVRRPTLVSEGTESDELAAARLHATGVALARRGDVTRAEQYLAAALARGHDPRSSVQALVATCVQGSQYRAALSHAATYLSAHPNDLALRRLKASLHMALGEPLIAEGDLSRVLAHAPLDADAHYLMALVLQQRGGPRALVKRHFARYAELAPRGVHADEARAALEDPG